MPDFFTSDGMLASHTPGADILPTQSQTAELRTKAQQFNAAYNNHLNMENHVKQYYPDLYPKWQELATSATTVKNTIISVMAKIDGLTEWLRSASSALDGLGMLPALVPGAVWVSRAAVAGAIAYATAKLTELYTYAKMVDDRDKLIMQGVDPQTAANIAQQANSGVLSSLFGGSQMNTLYIIGGLGLLLFILNKRR